MTTYEDSELSQRVSEALISDERLAERFEQACVSPAQSREREEFAQLQESSRIAWQRLGERMAGLKRLSEKMRQPLPEA